ncbi:MAG: hypothetical protein IPM64_16320 [Phycisphaerales bacterium]|nr:hypothetical protein [Phycisphaerales bacterium]
MTAAFTQPRFSISCVHCNRPITVRAEWVERDVRCPLCSGVVRVPEPGPPGVVVRGRRPPGGSDRAFNFACGRCRALLETNTGMCGQSGRCPTCAATFIVPHVDPDTGQPRGDAEVSPDGENPTPMHAYAASGSQAPQIGRAEDGSLFIECPRCGGRCDIDANACGECGVPFTIEAAPTARDSEVGGLAIASVVLGGISLASAVTGVLLICAMIALACGGLGLSRATRPRNTLLSALGLALGVAGILLFIYWRL